MVRSVRKPGSNLGVWDVKATASEMDALSNPMKVVLSKEVDDSVWHATVLTNRGIVRLKYLGKGKDISVAAQLLDGNAKAVVSNGFIVAVMSAATVKRNKTSSAALNVLGTDS
jgi:hypothetical protein